MSFLSSKRVGNAGEKLVCSLFRKAGILCDRVEGKSPDYDLVCLLDDEPFFVEVKTDNRAETTGNIAIEFYNTRTSFPSGLNITQAQIWAHIISGKVYIIGVNHLRKVAVDRHIRAVEGGDDNALLFLYNQEFLKNFVRIDKLGDAEILKTVRKILGDERDGGKND